MDYVRKKRWVRYNHIKCKMYLRNDFRFECAYCRMRERDTGVLGEAYFQKEHFIAKSSGEESILDAYDNLIYACEKCNNTKSDQGIELLLNPCKDNIYSGASPHVKNLGKNGQYQLAGNTDEGCRYIDALQLNSRFYREMREKQEQACKDDCELKKLVNEISNETNVPEKLLQKLKDLLHNNYLVEMTDQKGPDFKCGHSRAGRGFREVLDILEDLSVPYELLFAENDFDVKVRYNDKEYLCEIVLNDSAKQPVRNIRVKKEQRESWLAEAGEHGVLYYYLKTGRLEFYGVGEENKLLACLKDC